MSPAVREAGGVSRQVEEGDVVESMDVRRGIGSAKESYIRHLRGQGELMRRWGDDPRNDRRCHAAPGFLVRPELGEERCETRLFSSLHRRGSLGCHSAGDGLEE